MGHRLQVLIPPDLHIQIDKAAQRSGVSKGEWVRRALEESLLRGGSGSPTNPVDRLAALACPVGAIDEILAEVDEGRR